MSDVPTTPEEIAGVFDALWQRSQCATRVARHLLRIDLHETWNWARSHPDKLSVATAEERT
jgi:hypothetical protein